MEQIKIENLSFTYSLADEPSLRGISLCVHEGEYVVACGKSGCGKTTLLRHLKPAIAPHGKKEGKIYFNGRELDTLDLRTQSQKIGFVMQDPESQIVTDKVWHELAFGLENLGLDTSEIRLRVAEMASYFGIDGWFDKKICELSGGQKQILNLASIMAMHPDVLVLDEPTSRLDPIAAERFLSTVSKINRELGVTVIITEHRLEDVFRHADRIAVLEDGRIIADEAPENIMKIIDRLPLFVRLSLPTSIRIFAQSGCAGNPPITVRDARRMLREQSLVCREPSKPVKRLSEKNAVEFKNVSFRYERNGADIIRSLNLKIPQNCVFAVLGGNGAGKTTLSKLAAGTEKPYSGKIKMNGSCAVMPQEVRTLFTSRRVEDELKSVCANDESVERTASLTQTKKLFDRHPFDLSGGEQQRLAVAKLLLCDRDIYFFDEPTKGMDAEFKVIFADILRDLIQHRKTVVLISHDIEFCAENADVCAMLFDGEISAVRDTRRFFCGNRFYTTAASKISRGFIDGAITDKDVIECLKK